MELILYILAKTVSAVLFVLEIAMFLRAILSWFIPDEENRFVVFLNAVTEPFIYPIRHLFDRFHIAEGIPIDIPFLVAFLLISLLRMFL